ncbi:DUF488 family protein [Kitasatospora sp. NPDC085895]|uniref:DUF488 domain-containing protein n=1 Tax=Kitasatospora sp. NPDC085895 TaxID=3155057 RepID=UPI00344B500E
MAVTCRRLHDEPGPDEGTLVLVDRLWPRGLGKADAGFDEWAKTVAPSTELRRWYGHDPERWTEFRRRYRTELDEPERAGALDHLRALAHRGPLTLLTASHEVGTSHAAYLAELLNG